MSQFTVLLAIILLQSTCASRHHLRERHRSPSTDDIIITRAVTIGAFSVGKTSLLHRFTHPLRNGQQSPLPARQPTVAPSVTTWEGAIDGVQAKVNLWDTAGQERFAALATLYYRDADIIFVVFDISNEETLGKAKEWLERVTQEMISKPQVLALVGNKADRSRRRRVSVDEAVDLARQYSATYFEVSAKNG